MTVAVLTLGAITLVGSLVTPALPIAGIVADVAAIPFLSSGLVWRWMTRRLRRELGDEEAGQRFAGARAPA